MFRPNVSRLLKFLRAEDGPTAVEYAVVLALLILVCFVAIGTVGKATVSNYNNIELKTAIE